MIYSDEKYAFIEDVRDRKEIGKNSRYKVSGARSKKCNFPSDYLSKKERSKLNGECKTWNYGTFYSKAEFLEMSPQCQKEYIEYMSEKYSVSLTVISEVLFKMSSNWLQMYLNKNDITVVTSTLRGAPAIKAKTAFINALRSATVAPALSMAKEIEPIDIRDLKSNDPEPIEESVKPDIPQPKPERLELVMSNGINYMLLNTLASEFPNNVKVTIIIETIN